MDTRRWLASRRALLGLLGAAGAEAALPRRRAWGAPAIAPRFIVVHVPEGMWNGAKRPTVGATTLGPIFDPLDPFKAQLSVLLNLNLASRDKGPGGDGHHRAVPHMLTCTEMADVNNAGGASVDQKIAKAIGGNLKFESLQFAVRIIYDSLNSRPIWSGPSKMLPAMQSPWDAYARIFGDAVSPGPTGGGAATGPKFDLKKSAMDYALADMAPLVSRLSAKDRERVASYQDSLRDIELRLGATAPSGGATTGGGSCGGPMLGATTDIKAEPNVPALGKMQMDLMVAALQCGLTRVASLQWGNSVDQCAYSWLGVNRVGHDLAHNLGNCDPGGTKKQTVFRWYSEQFAYLLGKLQGVREGGGTMLDNTVVLWVSEFSEGNGHRSDKLTWLLMGNAGGYFKHGRVLDLDGRSVNDLHTTICNAFGIKDTTFGNPAYCNGPLTALTAG